MTVNKELIKSIKQMNGKIIGIGISEQKILDTIDKNDSILMCDLLNSNISSNNNSTGKKSKTFYINKLRKKYKYKKINNIICNVEEIDKYLKTFIKDSIYINKDEIYFYSLKKYDSAKIINKYNRYNTNIEKINCSDGLIIKINTKQAKNNYIKDKLFYIKDSFEILADIIGDILAS